MNFSIVTYHDPKNKYHHHIITVPILQENTPEEDRTIPMRENTYVRVFGNVRSFQNQRSLVAFKITPIEDMNELTTHLLEVVHSHLWWTKAQHATVRLAFCLLNITKGRNWWARSLVHIISYCQLIMGEI